MIHTSETVTILAEGERTVLQSCASWHEDNALVRHEEAEAYQRTVKVRIMTREDLSEKGLRLGSTLIKGEASHGQAAEASRCRITQITDNRRGHLAHYLVVGQ